MSLKTYVKLTKLAYNPPHLLLHVGLILVLFSINLSLIDVFNHLNEFFIGTLLVLPISGGLMLINEANDIEEDKLTGKKTVLTNEEASKKQALLLSLFLYLISLITSALVNKNNSFLFFLSFALITWWYSDKTYLGNLIGFRLKEHYLGEITAYIGTYLTYVPGIWLVFSGYNSELLVLTISFLFLGLFSLFIKDIKDTSNDKEAGLKTMASVFRLRTLLRISLIFLTLFCLIIIFSSTTELIDIFYFAMIFPLLLILKSFYSLWKVNWKIDQDKANDVKRIAKSFYLSLIILYIVNLI